MNDKDVYTLSDVSSWGNPSKMELNKSPLGTKDINDYSKVETDIPDDLIRFDSTTPDKFCFTVDSDAKTITIYKEDSKLGTYIIL